MRGTHAGLSRPSIGPPSWARSWSIERCSERPGASPPPGYASKRRKIVTAFWPPKPKPLIATVSSFASRATSGT